MPITIVRNPQWTGLIPPANDEYVRQSLVHDILSCFFKIGNAVLWLEDLDFTSVIRHQPDIVIGQSAVELYTLGKSASTY